MLCVFHSTGPRQRTVEEAFLAFCLHNNATVRFMFTMFFVYLEGLLVFHEGVRQNDS